MKLFYNIFLYFLQPFIWLFLLLRSFQIPAYRRRWAERYGFCKKKVAPEGILLHSVSVGETLSAISLIRTLRYRYPLLPITVTTMTPTGSECVVSTLGKEVHHVYLPYDLPCAMHRFLDTVRPKLVIVMETELWPNMISALYRRKIPLVIANARLSERSEKGYKKLGKFIKNLLNKITLITVQNEEDAARFISLGLKHHQLAISINLKFDFSIKNKLFNCVKKLRQKWKIKQRQIWIASSTHEGEEIIILQAHLKLLKYFPSLLLILVPRHPERFKAARKIVKKIGFNFVMKSSGEIPSEKTQVVIGDTIGELILLYGISDLAFVGGSLVPKGGHNPLEPAAYAIPILMGPYTFNFKDICNKLKKVKGLITVTDSKSLAEEIFNLLIHKEYRFSYGKNAIKVLDQHQGALSQFLNFLEPYLPFQDY